MAFTDLQSFISRLERDGDLKRVSVEVDPELEVTEIATRSVREGGPALLFENVKGSAFPLAINLLASNRRIETALGRHPEQIGEELLHFAEEILPPTPSAIWRNRKAAWKMLNFRPRKAWRAPVQQVVNDHPDLVTMPILKCWPKDGGRFITLPLVFSKDPLSGKGNIGIYRMQMFDATTTGMHMQIQKGGGFHYHNAEKLQQPLEMAAVIGADPALILAGVMALPEGIDEIAFAGIVRGKRTPVVKARTLDMRVPANAEFVLEGTVRPGRRRLEGPFGDHFGHYSGASEFPVFEIRTITRRQAPVYAGTVVGKPPQEDRFMGDATQMILGPLLRLMHREIRDLWAYYEAGFHNLLVISVETRYTREPIKTALSILGEGQLSLTKTVILVGPEVNPRDPSEVLQAIRRNFDPEEDFQLIARTPQDTLDFTGEALHRGSKMILDATGGATGEGTARAVILPKNLSQIAPGILRHRLVGRTLLVVQVEGAGRHIIESLVRNPLSQSVKLVAAVSRDVNIDDDVELLWGIFTRFDCGRDVMFTDKEFRGIAPAYGGVMGIDATWKAGYQEPLAMDPEIVRKVDEKWHLY